MADLPQEVKDALSCPPGQWPSYGSIRPINTLRNDKLKNALVFLVTRLTRAGYDLVEVINKPKIRELSKEWVERKGRIVIESHGIYICTRDLMSDEDVLKHKQENARLAKEIEVGTLKLAAGNTN